MNTKNIAFDASTKRRIDDNGFMHVESSHITKEQVAPYYGYEIPNYEKFNLEPNKIYYGYRSAEELQKAVPTFNGLPLLLHHHAESADEPQKEYRVGSVGTSAVWNAPYIDNALAITDKAGIQAVEDGTCREISSAYQYDPDFTKGEFEGKPYDFVMRNIRGNHVALVEEGRAGPDVVVADAQIKPNPKGKISAMNRLKNFFKGAWDSDPEEAIEQEDPKPIEDEDKSVKVKAIVESLAEILPPDKLSELSAALNELASGKEEAIDEDPEAEVPPAEPPAEEKPAPEKIEDDEEPEPAPAPAKEEPPAEPPAEEPEPPVEEDEEPAPEPAPEEEEDPLGEAKDAWDKCGMDSDDPAVKKAFAKGFSCGSEGNKKAAIAQDAQIRRAVKQLEAQFEAANEVGKVIGAVKPMAFDSVPDIYSHALREMGVAPSAFNDNSASGLSGAKCTWCLTITSFLPSSHFREFMKGTHFSMCNGWHAICHFQYQFV